MTFLSLGLSELTLATVKAIGYEAPTPIQSEAIPLVLSGHDLFGCAQTGTGKTASYVLPILDLLSKGRARARLPRVLVLVPTRELAHQVLESFEILGQNHKIKLAALIGGESMIDQEKKMSLGADIIVATPGRLLDILERGKILMTGIQYLVLDEADRMLDMGFIPDVDKILNYIPKKHQTLFFSATISAEIKKLTQHYLQNPKEINIAPPASTGQNIEQFVILTPSKDKNTRLRALISSQSIKSAIIFCNRKRDVTLLATSLKRYGFLAAMMHGDLAQAERTKTLELFKQKEIDFLVASDVAARGIDIDELPYVINYDVPMNAEEYVHRIGRTGRAGHKGIAYTFVSDSDKKQLKAIEALIQTPLKVFEALVVADTVEPAPKAEKIAKPRATLKVEKSKAAPQVAASKIHPQAASQAAATPLPYAPVAPQTVTTPQVTPKTAAVPKAVAAEVKKSVAEKRPGPVRHPKTDGPVYGFGSETPAFFSLQWGDCL